MEFVIAASTILVLATIGIGIYSVCKGVKGKNLKTVLKLNSVMTFAILLATIVVLASGSVQAATEAEAAQAASGSGMGYIAAALSTGLATIGAGIAVAIASSAALGAISENDKLLGKTLIFVGLAEGIAIYGLIVSILILGKL